jgi:cbb3-type cytochrome oxidase subunit 3
VTAFIFTGDMLVMLFMILVVVWVSIYESEERLDHTARIPLEDEADNG